MQNKRGCRKRNSAVRGLKGNPQIFLDERWETNRGQI